MDVTADPASPFLARLDAFWTWFEREAPRLRATIDAGDAPDLADELGARIETAIPGIAWQLCPGRVEGDHALALSPEGNRDHALLASVWLARAPTIPGWDAFDGKPP